MNLLSLITLQFYIPADRTCCSASVSFSRFVAGVREDESGSFEGQASR